MAGGSLMFGIMKAARYLVFLSYGENRNSLTPLKLQKLLYLAQGWSYVWDGVPVFEDEFCAWQYGPVNEQVYEAFKQYGRSEIPQKEGIARLEDETVADTLEAIWLEYGKRTAYDLVELTHNQEPWKTAYLHGNRITNSSIQKYFQSTY